MSHHVPHYRTLLEEGPKNPRDPAWVAFDFDATLSEYQGFKGARAFGPPIQPMVDLAKAFHAKGFEVVILTARATHPDNTADDLAAIAEWCLKYLGFSPLITGEKSYRIVLLFDDRAVQVIPNTGVVVEVPNAKMPVPQ